MHIYRYVALCPPCPSFFIIAPSSPEFYTLSLHDALPILFWIGALPALLALYIRTKVPESEAWKQHRAASTGEVLRVVAGQWRRFLYLVLLMTFMMFLSHGTQDLYPDFLQEVHKVSAASRANIAMIYNIAAVIGAIIFGHLSQVAGRRKGMMAALALSLLMIPFWAFGWSIPVLIAGACLMQA